MRSEYISKEEFECMLKDLKEDYKLIMLVSLETGLRLSDVLTLTYPQALWGAPIKERKTGKTCIIDLPTYLRNALMMRDGAFSSSTALVFPSGGDGERNTPYNRSTIYRAVKRAAEGCEVNVTPHTARKIYAVETYRKTRDIREVKRRLRHDRLETTLLYAFSDKLQQFQD